MIAIAQSSHKPPGTDPHGAYLDYFRIADKPRATFSVIPKASSLMMFDRNGAVESGANGDLAILPAAPGMR